LALVDDSAGKVKLETPKGSVNIRVKCTTDAKFTLVRSGAKIGGNVSGPDESARGWVSTTYASKQPALSLALEANCRLPITFETVFEFAENEPSDLKIETRPR
jgi:hypothetical protein